MSNNLNKTISDSLRRITLGSANKRLQDPKVMMGGVGTTRMVRGWVSKVHNDKNDPEYKAYAGTIDVTEFYDQKYTEDPVVYKGVVLSGKMDDNIGFVIIPALHSDVTILIDSGSANKYVVDYTYAEMAQVKSHNKTVIGAKETEKLNTEDEESPDYDELECTGNESNTEYLPTKIISVIKDKDGNIYKKETDTEGYEETVGKATMKVKQDGVLVKYAETEINITDGKIVIGGSSGKSTPTVKGTEYAALMKDFLIECSQIMTPTMLGTVSPVNFANFTSLISRLDSTLSTMVFTQE